MDAVKCPVRAGITDAMDLMDHENDCAVCRGGLVKDLPKLSTKLEPVVPAVPKGQFKSRKRKGENIEKEPDLLELPHKKALHVLKKTEGLSKPAAALALLTKRREVGAPEKPAETSKEEVAAKDMPYVPPYIPLPKDEQGRFRTSVLSLEDHRRYVAIITNNLKPESAARFQNNNLELKGYDEQLFEERNYFYKIAMEWADKSEKHPYSYETNGCRALFLKKQKKRLEVIGNRKFGREIKTLNWVSRPSTQSAQLLKPRIVQNLTEGRVPTIKIPDPRRKCFISAGPSIIEEKLEDPKLGRVTIESDQNAINFATQSNIEVIMDGCTVRSLLTDSYVFRKQKIGFKVEVVRKICNGQYKRVIIISKPFLTDKSNPITVERDFIKWSLKATILQAVQKRTKMIVKKARGTEADIKEEIIEADHLEELKISEKGDDSQNSTGNEVKAEKMPEKVVKEENGGGDLLDNILGSMGVSYDFPTSEPRSVSTKSDYRYSVLRIGEDVQSRVLIRTNNHGRDVDHNLMSLSVKPEYIPSLGAEVIHEEEEMANYFTTLMKDAEKHLVFRIHANNRALLQIERKKASTMYSQFEDHTRQLVSYRCERFNRLLEFIKGLEEGNYLLMRDGENMRVFDETIEGEQIWTDTKIFAEVAKRLLRIPKKRKNKWRKHLDDGSNCDGEHEEGQDEGQSGIKEDNEEVQDEENGNVKQEEREEEKAVKQESVEEMDNSNRFGDVEPKRTSISEEKLDPNRDTNPWEVLGKPSELFQGINVRIPLVWQIVQSRIPGSLPPARPEKFNKNKGKKWKKHQPKVKNEQVKNERTGDLFGSQIL
ncbi:unnamed protein product [Bursaphelenchus xylophilus]|uniref:(pine wood nematode) hypothetical protein n=1 Tax=Bursaphelenchus xylophilus TaxID=6326 RepID=A0A1I7RJ33_BURXY|nr:unnamed protein product [Bursaphelenchus xylophilus]CAG9119307.1 unnamed protein product [Bursaphelenchus xylophilus]